MEGELTSVVIFKLFKTCLQWYGAGGRGRNLQIETGCCREERLDTVVLVLNIDSRTVLGERF
jgi:hypothetical protein